MCENIGPRAQWEGEREKTKLCCNWNYFSYLFEEDLRWEGGKRQDQEDEGGLQSNGRGGSDPGGKTGREIWPAEE